MSSFKSDDQTSIFLFVLLLKYTQPINLSNKSFTICLDVCFYQMGGKTTAGVWKTWLEKQKPSDTCFEKFITTSDVTVEWKFFLHFFPLGSSLPYFWWRVRRPLALFKNKAQWLIWFDYFLFFWWNSSGLRFSHSLPLFSHSDPSILPWTYSVRHLDDRLSALAVTFLCDLSLRRESSTSELGGWRAVAQGYEDQAVLMYASALWWLFFVICFHDKFLVFSCKPYSKQRFTL